MLEEIGHNGCYLEIQYTNSDIRLEIMVLIKQRILSIHNGIHKYLRIFSDIYPIPIHLDFVPLQKCHVKKFIPLRIVTLREKVYG